METNKVKRTLHIGERIYVDDANSVDLRGYGTIELINGEDKDFTITTENEEYDTIVTIKLNNHYGECEEEARNIYQIDENASERAGVTICIEHDDMLSKEYPYYSPDLDENIYDFEIENIKSRIDANS